MDDLEALRVNETNKVECEETTNSLTPTDSNLSQINYFLAVLVHTSTCPNEYCQYRGCIQLKRVILHSKSCRLVGQNCRQCVQLISLIIYHSKNCSSESDCQVILCKKVKEKIEFNRAIKNILSMLELLSERPRNNMAIQTDQINQSNSADPLNETNEKREKLLLKIEELNSLQVSNEPKAILLKTTRQKTRQHLLNIYFKENQSEMNLKSKDDANLVATVFRKESEIASRTSEPNDYFCLIAHLFHNINQQTKRIRLKSVSVQTETNDQEDKNDQEPKEKRIKLV